MIRFSFERLVAVFLSFALLSAFGSSVCLAAVESQMQGAGEIKTVEVQKALKEAGYYEGAVDGIIGSKTRAAIRAFQQANGLSVDGVCGPRTWEKLKVYLNPPIEAEPIESVSTPSLDEEAPIPYSPAEAEPGEEDLKQKLIS